MLGRDRHILGQIRREVDEEFPDDPMMQEIHVTRRLHQLRTEGMTVREQAAFYNSRPAKRDEPQGDKDPLDRQWIDDSSGELPSI